MVVDGVVIPVRDPSAEGAVEGRGDDLDAGLDQATGHQALLAPLVEAVALADPRVFPAEVEGPGGLGAGQQAHRLGLEGVHRIQGAGPVDVAAEVVERPPQRDPLAQPADLPGVGQADVGHLEVRGARVSRHGEGLVRGAEIPGAGDREVVVVDDRVDADVVREVARSATAQVVGDAHEVGIEGRELVLRGGVSGEELQRARRMPAPGVRHRAEDRELVRELGLSRQQLGEAKPGRPGGDRRERPPVVGRDIRLGVVRIQVAATPAQPDEDHRRRPARLRRGLRPQPEQPRQRERPETGHPGPQELAPRRGPALAVVDFLINSSA